MSCQSLILVNNNDDDDCEVIHEPVFNCVQDITTSQQPYIVDNIHGDNDDNDDFIGFNDDVISLDDNDWEVVHDTVSNCIQDNTNPVISSESVVDKDNCWQFIEVDDVSLIQTNCIGTSLMLAVETTRSDWEVVEAIPIVSPIQEKKNTSFLFVQSIGFYGISIFLLMIICINMFITIWKIYRYILALSIYWNIIIFLFSICIFVFGLVKVTEHIKRKVTSIRDIITESCSPKNILKKAFFSFSNT
jgi:hypothetical protein